MTIDHYRELLNELKADIAQRVRAEEALAALAPENEDLHRRNLERALQSLTTGLQQDQALVDERHVAGRQALEDRLRHEVAGIRAAYCHKAAELGRVIDAELERVREKYAENCWLLSSILDDESEASPKKQFERLEAQLEQSKTRLMQESHELEIMTARAVAIVEGRRMRTATDLEPTAPSPSAEEALRRFSAAKELIGDRLGLLSRQMVVRIFEGWNLLIGGVLLWGLLLTTILLFVDPRMLGLANQHGLEWLLISGGAAFGVIGVAMLTTYAVTGSRTGELLDPLQQAWADAQSHHRQWLQLSNDELLRRHVDFEVRQQAIVERRAKSLDQFVHARDGQVAELEQERQVELREATQVRQAALRAATEQHEQAILTHDAAHSDERHALQAAFDEAYDRLLRDHEQQRARRTFDRTELTIRATTAWTTLLAKVGTQTATWQEESQRLFPDWRQIAAKTWLPPETIPPAIRLGDCALDLRSIAGAVPQDPRVVPANTTFLLPCALPFPTASSLLLKADGAGRTEAVTVLQTAMLRLLAQLPPGDVRFTIIDPVGLGENFAAFMHLADYDDILITGRIWTEAAQIEEQLARLTEHMENVFQKYLRNEFETIEAYNEHAGEVAEPYRILVVANFPANFSERTAQRLVSIATSGARCGVYTLVSVDTRQPLPRGFDLADLEAAATVLEWKDGHFLNCLLGPRPLPLVIDAPPSAALAAELIRKVGDLSRNVRRVKVPFHRIAPRPEGYWTADSRAGLEVPLGRAGANKLQHLRLGVGTSQHVLVAGKTGSGKSTLLNVIITDLALRYAPDEVEFYLIDFKKGVEFKTYATHRLPHARIVSIESDREFGVSVLERLDAVLKERGHVFRQEAVQDIKAFRDARPDVRMPRVLLVVDEFQEFFVEDDRYSQAAALLLDRLVRQGRAFGIHVLLGSQSLGGAYSLARTTVGQMAVRIALQCSEADAHLILSEENSAARLLTRPGEAIYNDANGLLEGNSPFQTAWLGDEERDALLDRINDLAAAGGSSRQEPIVFEGNVPADPARNRAFCELIDSTSADESSEVDAAAPPHIWVGDAVAITGPTRVSFPRRSGANLLIVGHDREAAFGMLANSLMSLSAQFPSRSGNSESGPAGIHLLAGESTSGDSVRWARIVEALPHSPGISGRTEAPGVLAEIASEVVRRHEQRAPAPAIFLFIDDLSRFRDLRKAEDDFGFGSSDREKRAMPGQLLADVLRDGPEVGVHVVVWCDSYTNLDRWFSRASLREFDRRIALQMSASDSSSLIDSPAASRLGVHRALLYSDEQGTTEKFRPYGPPADEWLERLRRRKLPATATEILGVAEDIDSWVVT